MTGSIHDRLAALAQIVHELPASVPLRLDGRAERRWQDLDQCIGTEIAGRRVLVLGPEVADDALAFSARGARDVSAWASLDAVTSSAFDLVYCPDLLYRVKEPLALLQRLRGLTEPGGTLVIGSAMVDDPERSEYLRFVPDRYAGDPAWWFVPGRLAFRWLVETAGFDVEAEFGEHEGPRDLFPVVFGYLKATARP